MWFAIRVTYGRELKFQTLLNEEGFETFVPMKKKTIERAGKKTSVLAPAVSNLCFVNAQKSVLDAFMHSMGEACPARYLWDKATRQPIVVPDKAMQDFIRICTLMSDETLYLKDITSKLHEGQRVRVIDGPFKGIEGVILRIKRSRRVIVELSGLLAVATNFIDPRSLEVISES